MHTALRNPKYVYHKSKIDYIFMFKQGIPGDYINIYGTNGNTLQLKNILSLIFNTVEALFSLL